ncbi:MAG: MBL fold metallo-hydrolase, partial [Halobacteriota archaeon]
MTFRVTFLGTSGAVPTPARNPIGIFVNREGEGLLFDIGEGIQRQMMRFSTGFAVEYVFLTHLHGDHYYGLPGLLETLEFTDRTTPLTIFCPAGTTGRIESIIDLTIGETTYPVHVAPAAPDAVIVRAASYEVRSFAVDHDTRAVGYAIVEDERPGRFDRERAIDLG